MSLMYYLAQVPVSYVLLDYYQTQFSLTIHIVKCHKTTNYVYCQSLCWHVCLFPINTFSHALCSQCNLQITSIVIHTYPLYHNRKYVARKSSTCHPIQGRSIHESLLHLHNVPTKGSRNLNPLSPHAFCNALKCTR